MVVFALHVEDRRRRSFGNQVDVLVTNTPHITVADSNAVIHAARIWPISRSVSRENLGGFAFNESRVAAQVGECGFKCAAGAGAVVKEQHRQCLVAQVRVGSPIARFALQVPGDVENGFDFFNGEIEVTEKITALQIALHINTPSYKINWFES